MRCPIAEPNPALLPPAATLEVVEFSGFELAVAVEELEPGDELVQENGSEAWSEADESFILGDGVGEFASAERFVTWWKPPLAMMKAVGNARRIYSIVRCR